jgi:predicted transcriptional regulator
LTDLELDVMNVVWRQGSTTVRQIMETMSDHRPLAYTTVQTVLTILHQKGFVHYTSQGRAYVYHPAVRPEDIRKDTVSAVVDKLFSGSPRSLMLHLIESETLSVEEAEELRKILDRRLQEAIDA